jgi:hypothetical protein
MMMEVQKNNELIPQVIHEIRILKEVMATTPPPTPSSPKKET